MKKTILIITFILSMNIVLAAVPSLTEFNYDFTKTISTDNTMHYSQSILLTINTPSETECYYTIVKNSIPSNEFDVNYGTKHEKIIHELQDGLHKYYIKCGTNSSDPIMETSFKTKSTVSAQIDISGNAPINVGTYNINLITSSYILGEPTLEYSLDGIVYNPIPLQGSGKNWQGYLIVNNNIGETVLSFKFKATDLDGKEGTLITGDNIMMIDTKAPEIIQTIKAIGQQGQIELTWHLDEEVEEYHIYKSERTGVDHTNYYKTTDDQSFIDNEVENGKTYYYKVTAVDKAENSGSLSKEISATALLAYTTAETGLNPSLVGRVDNLLTEISLIKEDIQTIKTAIESKNEKEKQIFEDLKLNTELDNANTEITSLSKDIERFKLQDLSELELDKKLNTAKLRLEIIKKRIPETLTIIDEAKIRKDLSYQNIQKSILEYGQDSLTEKQIERTISQTEKLIKEQEMIIESEIYNIVITYLDGSKNQITLFRDTINAQMERTEDIRILLLIPKEIVDTATKIQFNNRNYEVIKEDPLLAFDADTKKIIYTIQGHTATNKLEDIVINPIKIYTTVNTGILTGFVSFNSLSENYSNIGYIILGIVLLLLISYFIHIKANKKSENFIKINEQIEEAKKHKKEKANKKLSEIYKEIKKSYNTLEEKEKEKIYSKIKKLHKK